MAKRQRTFSLRVHLGLLTIIALLLLINAVTNYMLWQSRQAQERTAMARFGDAVRAVARRLNEQFPQALTPIQVDKLKATYQLSRITVVPSAPKDDSPEGRRKWFAAMAGRIPPREWPSLAAELLAGKYHTLLRAEDDEFFVVEPVQVAGGRQLVIIHDHLPQLVMLEKARALWLWISVVSLVLVAIIYLLLVQLVVRPIHRILEQAREAGRISEDIDDEAETAVAEYERTIAELRRLHEALKQRAESLEQFNQYLLTSMDAGVVTFDPEGKLKTINPAAQRLLKVADVSEGSPVSELFRSFPELNALAGDLLREGGEPRYREVRCRSGEEDTVFGVLATRIVNDNGQQVGCALLLNDLTELYRLRANLEQKTRLAALGEMAAGLAHQIRNSLGAITGFARLIGRRADNEQLRRTSDNLVGEAEQAGELIERFLSLARPLDIQAGSVEIVALLRELVSSFAVQTGTDSITFSVTGEPELYVQGDALLLKQVFGNLLDNAIKACANRQAAIVVDIQSTSAGEARVTVTDDGPGIPKEDIDKLFTPFFSTRPSGTGLGLSLVAKIVDAHHGAITVDSTVGEGTTVVVHLPLYVHAGTESVPSETVSRS